MNNMYIFPTRLLWGVSSPNKMQLLSILSNQMAFQQRIKVNLLGEMEPDGQITIKHSRIFHIYIITISVNSKWSISIILPQSGSPCENCISNYEEITLEDILKGKICFRTRLSNISIPLQEQNGQPIKGTNKVPIKVQEKLLSEFSIIICRTNIAPLENAGGKWLRLLKENLQKTCGITSFSGQLLLEILNIPMGLVVFACRVPEIKVWLDYKVVDDMLGVFLYHSLCQSCNAMVYSFGHFTIEGVLWHQNENNRITPKITRLFLELLKSFCKVWELENLLFYDTQLTPYKCNGAEKESNARIRKVQMQNKEKTSNVGMVITLDVGDEKYSHLIKKRKIGQRLVRWELAKAYGCKGFRCQLPIYESAEIKKQEGFFSFENLSYYMVFLLTNFKVAGRDRIFHQG